MEKVSKTSNTTKNNWSDPPKDILFKLLNFIDLTIDLPRLRGVNTCWRSSLPLDEIPIPHSGESRLTVPPLESDQSGPSSVLKESRLYLISPLTGNGKPWLSAMTNIGPGKWHLLHPFNLQDNYLNSSPPVVGEINLLDCRVVEVASIWVLNEYLIMPRRNMVSKKVVGGWNNMSDYKFAALVLLKIKGGLKFKRLHDQKWMGIESESCEMLDIAYHDGNFYAFEFTKWKVGVIDPEKSSISIEYMDAPAVLSQVHGRFIVLIDGCSYLFNGVNLVASKTNLHLVIKLGSKIESTVIPPPEPRVIPPPEIMKVFLLQQGEWKRVKSLGDETGCIGILGKNDSVFQSNLGIWNEDSIRLFTMDSPKSCDLNYSSFEGIPAGMRLWFPRWFRVHLKTYKKGEQENGIVVCEDLPFDEQSELFFPPPASVKWRCPSLENTEVIMHNLTRAPRLTRNRNNFNFNLPFINF